MKIDRKAGLMDKVMANALKIQYLRDFILNKAKSSVMRATGGNYPAPLKVSCTTVVFHLCKMSLNNSSV